MLGYRESIDDNSTLVSAPIRHYDAVVVGAGVAGLTFAVNLPSQWRVAVLTKGGLGESNTRYAQGGLSAPIGLNDTVALHVIDTLSAGAGLCDLAAVESLVAGAPEAVDWLVSIGAQFDRDQATGQILLGKEAAHSRRRVLHAGGDATGAEIERALVSELRSLSNVHVFEHAFALDLNVVEGVCVGLIAVLGPDDTEVCLLDSPFVAMCAGGAGQLWATTSNPLGATADGLAMAIRAGVAIADTEFVQFHPTVISDGAHDSFLVSEAVRGEGAWLRNETGDRFMLDEHELAELAPRDVVARGIQRALTAHPNAQVFLDLRHLDPVAMRQRFPTIASELQVRGLDLATDLIPVAPAAHYFIGGIAAGTDGATSLPGLIALGEASCTGVHGANRLASNSLLEGLVFGKQAAEAVANGSPRSLAQVDDPPSEYSPSPIDWEHITNASIRDLRLRIQQTMSRAVSVVRSQADLEVALVELEEVAAETYSLGVDNRAHWQLMNMVTAAHAIASAALNRLESRGAHFRSDFPEQDPDLEHQHQFAGGLNGETWQFGQLADARQAHPSLSLR